jgi:hypothetical protein
MMFRKNALERMEQKLYCYYLFFPCWFLDFYTGYYDILNILKWCFYIMEQIQNAIILIKTSNYKI